MSSHTTESTRMIEVLAWVDLNKMKLLIGTGVVLVTIAAYAIYQWHRRQAEAEASAALFKADKPGGRSEDTPEANAQAFLQVATAYPGTSAGGRALLFAGAGLFRENKYAEAKREFESFLREYAENPLAPTAALGIAACLDALDKTNEAFAAYQDVLNRFAGAAITGQAKLGLARLYEVRNEPALALKVYDELTRSDARLAWGTEAAIRREQLLAQHPELAKVNAPSSSAISSAITSALGTNLPQLTVTNPASTKPANPK